MLSNPQCRYPCFVVPNLEADKEKFTRTKIEEGRINIKSVQGFERYRGHQRRGVEECIASMVDKHGKTQT